MLFLLAFSLLILLTVFTSVSGAVPSAKLATAGQSKSLSDAYEAQLYALRQNELKTALKAYFDRAIASGDIVGAGVSIVKGDSIVFSGGFGKRSSNSETAVNQETVFRLGSLSKGFAGVLAAQLKDEGKLDWEDRVSDCIPGFRLGDPKNTRKITLAHILSHTSGAPYHSYTNLVEAGLPLTDIAKRFKEVVPISEPGAMYSYQNALFALSSEIMQKVTGQEVTTLLENRFFKPLDMHNATLDNETLAHAKNVALPHVRRGTRWKSINLSDNYYNAIVAGGINASALDMAKWMRFLMGHKPEIMRPSVVSEALRPFIEIKGHHKYYQRWPGHRASYYGFGWRIHKFEAADGLLEKTIWHHGGSVNNYRNEIAMYPEADLGICVLLNSNSKIARTVIPDLYKLVNQVYAQPSFIIAQQ